MGVGVARRLDGAFVGLRGSLHRADLAENHGSGLVPRILRGWSSRRSRASPHGSLQIAMVRGIHPELGMLPAAPS